MDDAKAEDAVQHTHSSSSATEQEATPVSVLRPLVSSLECSICYNLIRTCLLTPCDHIFCALCIRRSLNFHSECPVCRKKFDSSQLRNNRVVDELVRSWKRLKPQLDQFSSSPTQADVPHASTQGDGSIANLTPSEKQSSGHTPMSIVSGNGVSVSNSSHKRKRSALDANGVGDATESNDGDLAEPADKKAKTEPKELACPVCGLMVRARRINRHLDECIAKPQGRQKFFDSNRHRVPSSVPSHKRPAKVAKVCYHLIKKDKALRKLLSDCGLPTDGTRSALIRRHKEYVVRHRAEQDSLRPMSSAQIARQITLEHRAKSNPFAANGTAISARTRSRSHTLTTTTSTTSSSSSSKRSLRIASRAQSSSRTSHSSTTDLTSTADHASTTDHTSTIDSSAAASVSSSSSSQRSRRALRRPAPRKPNAQYDSLSSEQMENFRRMIREARSSGLAPSRKNLRKRRKRWTSGGEGANEEESSATASDALSSPSAVSGNASSGSTSSGTDHKHGATGHTPRTTTTTSSASTFTSSKKRLRKRSSISTPARPPAAAELPSSTPPPRARPAVYTGTVIVLEDSDNEGEPPPPGDAALHGASSTSSSSSSINPPLGGGHVKSSGGHSKSSGGHAKSSAACGSTPPPPGLKDIADLNLAGCSDRSAATSCSVQKASSSSNLDKAAAH